MTDKLRKCFEDGIREMLKEKLVTLTNLLSERGISLTSQEKSCIVDLDYDASCYVDQLSNENSDEDDDNESDNKDSDEDDNDDESNEDSDENEDDSSE